jgi:hypothetical protein
MLVCDFVTRIVPAALDDVQKAKRQQAGQS